MEEEKGEEEISIDLSKITNFFKKKKKKELQEIKEEVKKIDKGIDKINETEKIKREEAKEKEEGEIAIDFGKITRFFKKKEKQKEEIKKEIKTEEESDEEFSIDFGKIKSIFKGKESKEAEEESEIKIRRETLTNIKNFFVKYWPYLLIIIPVFLTIFIRLQTVNLTITDDWARNNVYGYYSKNIANQIKQQYPNLPEQNLQKLVNENFKNFIKQNKNLVEQQIKDASKQFKGYFQYESGSHSYPYMGDIDSYYWLRQARNIIEKGYNCDVTENGKCYDTYTLAPQKLGLGKTLHPYSIVFVYKLLKPFNPDITLMQAQIITPTMYAVITVILVYLMMLWAFGPLAALTSSVLITANPIFLSRSLGSDTDIYNIFFSVLIIFFAFEAFAASDWKKKAIFAALSGLAIGSYSFAWIGWWYLFDFIFIAVVADYFISILKDIYKTKKFDIKEIFKREKTRNAAAILIPFFVFAFISVGMINSFASFKVTYLGPLTFTESKVAANPNIWPNVLTTVAEFNEASVSSIIGQMGGKGFFFLALFGFIALIYKNLKNVTKHLVAFLLSVAIVYYLVTPSGTSLSPAFYLFMFILPFLFIIYFTFKSEEETDIKLAAMFFLWVAASIYAATKGIRFTLLLVPPVAVGIGITFEFLHKSITQLLAQLTAKLTKKKFIKVIVSIFIFLVFSYYLISPAKAGISTAKNYLPSVNDQWWNALTQIKDNSKEDAIINSWWDFGHWFKYITNRRVTLDGSSQNNPQLHWLGKTLLTSDENEARGILRMLDCGGNDAFNTINKKKNDSKESIRLLYKMLLLEDKNKAKKILSDDGFTEEDAELILKYSHCEPPEDFFITSEDMIGKSGVWAHFGSWNFDRAWMHKTFNEINDEAKVIEMFMNELNFSRDEAAGYYSQIKSLKSDSEVNAWIAPWPGYIQSENACQNNSEIVRCTLQQLIVEVNLTTMDVAIPTSQGTKRVNIFSYTTPNGIDTQTYSSDTIGVGMVLLIKKDGYSSLFMAPQLVNSIFTKLFFLDGHGTKHFDLFHESRGSSKITIWKVNWQGRDKPIMVERFNATNPYFQTKPLTASTISSTS